MPRRKGEIGLRTNSCNRFKAHFSNVQDQPDRPRDLLILFNVRSTICARLNPRKAYTMMNSTKQLALAAAFAGLIGGTSVRVNAQTTAQTTAQPTSTAQAGVPLAQTTPYPAKHSCKGKNDCKGQGGGDAKHAGKNSCKGKGACATDGSKPAKS